MKNFGDINDLYTVQAIQSRLACLDSDIAKKVVFFEETDSTNNQAKKGAAGGDVSGTLYVAERQTGGRGRRGRQWLSPKGTAVLMSLMFKPETEPSAASMLTLVAALAAAKAISEAGCKTVDEANGLASCKVVGEVNCLGSCGTQDEAFEVSKVAEVSEVPRCAIKWPNDIVLNNRKVCGILTEMSVGAEGIDYVVIGVGINANTTEFDDTISETASSICREKGRFVKRSDIVVDFVKYFTKYYEIFKKTQDLSALVAEYNSMLVNVGREVRIIGETDEFIGKALGINEKGALLVRRQDGAVTEIVAGEVSVRGLYGYV